MLVKINPDDIKNVDDVRQALKIKYDSLTRAFEIIKKEYKETMDGISYAVFVKVLHNGVMLKHRAHEAIMTDLELNSWPAPLKEVRNIESGEKDVESGRGDEL